MAVRKHPLIAAFHVATGDFQKALELLKKQLAISNFDPLKQLFVDVFTLSKIKIQTLPHANPMTY
jgi:Coatomer (COPI) alpha subunit C-terminus